MDVIDWTFYIHEASAKDIQKVIEHLKESHQEEYERALIRDDIAL